MSQTFPIRIILSILVGFLVIFYTVLAVIGFIPAERKIDGVNLVIILIAAGIVILILHPELIDRLRVLEMAGFKLELLEEVAKKQSQQEVRLQELYMLLPLLLPEPEQKHLLNLANDHTRDYRGRDTLRDELRHLRSMGLIKMVNDHHISQITDGFEFDLAHYVRLEKRGSHWVEQIKEIERIEAKKNKEA